MNSSCVHHPFEPALIQCSRCADRLCSTCWVEARVGVLCFDCALSAAGVRSGGRSGRSAAAYRRRINLTEADPLEWDEIDLREWRKRTLTSGPLGLPLVLDPDEA